MKTDTQLTSISRRQFIGRAGGTALFLLSGASALAASRAKRKDGGEFAFVEAEQFADQGGWELDQQSMDQMGSAYLLAHGLGIPVNDATTRVKFPSAGQYRVWVRTRDWVAPWKAPGAPGKFKLLVNGKALDETFGTKNADWHWHDGGTVNVDKHANLALRDLTGFEGRCEAILFCKDVDFEPTNDVEALTKFRRKLLNLPDKPEEAGAFELIVVGGGLAGTCAAISAARNGVKVALIQDRPVLGGNGSSEVRVWPEGHVQRKPYPHIGDIVIEIMSKVKKTGVMNATAYENFDDQLKLDIVNAEPNITLFTEHRAMEVESGDDEIKAVIIQSTRTAIQKRLTGKYFADCTGDAKVGALGGADYEFSLGELMGSSNLFNVLDVSKKEELLKCECKDKSALSLKAEQGDVEQPFPHCPWALDLSDKPFPGRKNSNVGKREGLHAFANMWFWESGYNKNPITGIERIRDHNFRAMYGAWDALKNVDKLYPNHRLGWVAYIAGKRESRRLMGDVVLDGSDFLKGTKFNDACFPCTWAIDLHTPNKAYSKGFEGEEFIAIASNHDKAYHYKGTYWAPYRCLYSRNIKNLFMAGRDISVTKSGIGPTRVMKTCGTMGEIVGKAVSICVKHKTTPRGVYKNHLDKLIALMKLPGSDGVAASKVALVGAGEAIRTSEGEQITNLSNKLQMLRSLVLPRDSMHEPAPKFQFKVSAPTVVYISVHQRGGYEPPTGWEKTALQLVWRKTFNDVVYKKSFAAGIVKIPGHNGKSGDAYGFPHAAFVEGAQVEITL